MCSCGKKHDKFSHDFIVDRVPWRIHPDRRGALKVRLRDMASHLDSISDKDFEELAALILPLARRVGGWP